MTQPPTESWTLDKDQQNLVRVLTLKSLDRHVNSTMADETSKTQRKFCDEIGAAAREIIKGGGAEGQGQLPEVSAANTARAHISLANSILQKEYTEVGESQR